MRAGAWIVAAFVALPVARLADAQGGADVPFADVPAHRSADGREVEASAVGMPDERLPMVSARCSASRRVAERRARDMLHAYVDLAMRRSRATPTILAAVHAVVDERTRVTGARGLVDCGAVVRVAVPSSSLEAAARGAEVTFP